MEFSKHPPNAPRVVHEGRLDQDWADAEVPYTIETAPDMSTYATSTMLRITE